MIVAVPTLARADGGGWKLQPYRIQATLAIEVPGGIAEQWNDELPDYLRRRVDTSLIPGWNFDVQIATGAARGQVFSNLATTHTAKPADLPKEKDKLILLGVRATADGFTLTAREYDRYIDRWNAPIQRECRQSSVLPEQLFAILREAVSPLAQFDLDPKDPQRVLLTPRGADLPRAEDAPPWAKPGDIFLPVLRRTSRGGQLVENGIQPVPWTYLEATAGKDKTTEFHIQSGIRNPFGARRQGRVEQVAIGIRSDAGSTTLRLHARKNEKKPLIGYDVLVQKEGEENPPRIGTSDTAGEVPIPPGDARIKMLLIKHGGQLLAKLPIVPGAEQTVRVPLPDDDARLAAESRLAALREDLIDVVARRNILIARAKKKIDKKDFKGAQDLLRTLDELPGKPQFNNALDTSERLLRSDDPLMQRRIKQLFDATRTLTAQFLDLKPINELNNEFREAQQQPPPAPAPKTGG